MVLDVTLTLVLSQIQAGTCSTRYSRKMTTFACGAKPLRVFYMGILSDAQLISSDPVLPIPSEALHFLRKWFK